MKLQRGSWYDSSIKEGRSKERQKKDKDDDIDDGGDGGDESNGATRNHRRFDSRNLPEIY